MPKIYLLILITLLAGCSSRTVREVEKADRTMAYKATKAEVYAAIVSYCADEDWEIESQNPDAGTIRTGWKYFSPEVTFKERKKFTAEVRSFGQDTEVTLSMVDEMQDVKTSRWVSNKMASGSATSRYTEVLDGIGRHLGK